MKISNFVIKILDYIKNLIFWPCLIFLKNITKIASAEKKVVDALDYGGRNDVRIYLINNSETLIRDVLILFNSICVQAKLLKNKISGVKICINSNIKDGNFTDFYSAFHLIPLITDISFHWMDNHSIESLIREGSINKNTMALSNDIYIDINSAYSTIKNIDYSKTFSSNLLDVPLVTKVWARNILKGYHPNSFIISISLPEFKKNNGKDVLRDWRNFFLRVIKDLTHIHFLLFNYSLDWDDELFNNLHNVKVTKMLGYSYLEEFALVRLSDMFIGPYDKYAISVIGINKPFILFSSNDTNQINDEMIGKEWQLSRAKNQIWLLNNSSPADFYNKFVKFYMNLDGSRRDEPVLNKTINHEKI